jgi:predicted MPP superfamily phosphohydrolase
MNIILWIVILIFIYMHLETRFLSKTEIKYEEGKNTLKVAHISDVHIGKMFVTWKKIKRKLKEISPDILLLTGDYFENQDQINKFLKLIDYIRPDSQLIMTFGNHDYRLKKRLPEVFNETKKSLKKRGVIVLENNSYKFNKDNKIYNFIGIEDLKTCEPKVETIIDKFYQRDMVNIVASHNPDVTFSLSNEKIDYMFCGHFHGKQIWMPFDFEFKKLRKERMAQLGISRGRYNFNGIELYINRGIGNVLFPLRFFSTPEISVYYL